MAKLSDRCLMIDRLRFRDTIGLVDNDLESPKLKKVSFDINPLNKSAWRATGAFLHTVPPDMIDVFPPFEMLHSPVIRALAKSGQLEVARVALQAGAIVLSYWRKLIRSDFGDNVIKSI